MPDEQTRRRGRESAKKFREKYPEKVKENNQKYYDGTSEARKTIARRWRQSNRVKAREQNKKSRDKDPRKTFGIFLKSRYGITLEQYEELEREQNGLCAICGGPEKTSHKGTPRRLAVDHCHTTKRVRGLLCNHCNGGLGFFFEDVAILEMAIKYILKLRR